MHSMGVYLFVSAWYENFYELSLKHRDSVEAQYDFDVDGFVDFVSRIVGQGWACSGVIGSRGACLCSVQFSYVGGG